MKPPLSARIKAARGAAGMTLAEFAKAAGMGRSTLIRTEAGRRPDEGELRAIARVSGLPYEFFVITDLEAALGGSPDDDEALSRRVERLERDVAEIRRRLGHETP